MLDNLAKTLKVRLYGWDSDRQMEGVASMPAMSLLNRAKKNYLGQALQTQTHSLHVSGLLRLSWPQATWRRERRTGPQAAFHSVHHQLAAIDGCSDWVQSYESKMCWSHEECPWKCPRGKKTLLAVVNERLKCRQHQKT
mmetsp:Transcript_88810/g.153835  ORF Transcript_88810/g.153835 Transcript_88810/m.153835 type:complete len:139 (-) Transcript_88810:359-775(-)